MDILQQNLFKLKDERIKLFGEKNIKIEESNWTEKIELLNKKESKNKVYLSKKETELSTNNTQIIKNKEELKNIRKETISLENKVDPILQKINYSNYSAAINNLLSEQESKKILDMQQSLFNQKARTEQSQKDKDSQINKTEQNADSEKDIIILQEELNKKNEQLQVYNQEIGIIKTKLEFDLTERQKAKSLTENIKNQQKEFDKWHTLNELIGDSTGNKFSEFAQDLTLKQLLNLSNIHLLNLSKRYELDKSSDKKQDDLIIIDRFLGNTERSVRTLSGGESFLVSLSLALGLSDLASQNTKIESLFIDEGFGTLDEESLDSALNSLETLQNETNRTIGIISHVQALKDRISTQIKLTKISSGYSKITIIG